MSEEWRVVKGQTEYLVSDRGRVLSMKNNGHRILRPSTDSVGRRRVVLSGGKKTIRIQRRVHQLVMEAFGPPKPLSSSKYLVAHRDGNPNNNHISNLKWATHRENCADMVKHGTRLSGHRHGRAILDQKDRKMVFALFNGGITRKAIATRFGVSRSCIERILNKEKP